MTNHNRFAGVHSTILINLDNVAYAKGGNHAGSEITIHFVSRDTITLSGEEADMFRAQWRGPLPELPPKIEEKKNLYPVHHDIPNTCPVCKAPVANCHMGEYCSKNCGYVGGYAWLTKDELDKLLKKGTLRLW